MRGVIPSHLHPFFLALRPCPFRTGSLPCHILLGAARPGFGPQDAGENSRGTLGRRGGGGRWRRGWERRLLGGRRERIRRARPQRRQRDGVAGSGAPPLRRGDCFVF